MARDMKNTPKQRPGQTSGRGGPSVLSGLLMGLLLGLIIAVAVFYLVSANPPNFENLMNQGETPAPITKTKPATEELKPLGETPASQQRYDFYRILPGNQAASSSAPAKPAPKVVEVRPQPRYLQAGSFENPEEADNLKAKLAMLGLEVEIQTASIPDLGVRHRVRVGPLGNPDEIKETRALLSRSGIEAVLSKD